jgi:hypothetical protein
MSDCLGVTWDLWKKVESHHGKDAMNKLDKFVPSTIRGL